MQESEPEPDIEDLLPPPQARAHVLGDFTIEKRALFLAALALPLGILSGFLALVLLRLISFFTNIFFFGVISLHNTPPRASHLGLFIIIIPVLGATVVGLMARYGSEKIRGHGIPEAIEAILTNGSKVEPKVAILKPLSAAISIGSGGPFGAEGPIIMTGGSFGSLMGQFFHLSSAERKVLLVAGAAGGMSATFAAPLAAILLALELLLFEWKPRSILPVAVASVAAMSTRYYLLGAGPIFPIEPHGLDVAPLTIAACCVVGIVAGLTSAAVTSMVYGAEDFFGHLPFHWMWWPTLGGLAIGIGGYFFPRALGVGYDTIGELLRQDLAFKTMVGVLVVKSLIWSISLGSGTSGGVLAPLLMMGAALGGIMSGILPNEAAGFWPMVAMAAVFGGTTRAPLTATIFALELTHDMNMLMPVLTGVMFAHGVSVFLMKRSILTEKISRHGHHSSNEYSIDPLELYFVRDIMRTDFMVLPKTPTNEHIAQALLSDQDLFPIADESGTVHSVITREKLLTLPHLNGDSARVFKGEAPEYVHPAETLRALASHMAVTRATKMIVTDYSEKAPVLGLVSLGDMLKAYEKNIGLEETREVSLVLPLMRRTVNVPRPPLR